VQGQNIRYLFRLYKSNQISEKELQELFALMEKAEYDEELKQLLDEAWDETIAPPKRLWLKIAAVALLLIIPVYFLIPPKEKQQLSIYNPAGHAPIKILLEDSTRIWLNAASSLQYKDARDITLRGEAFFEVAHNVNKPFIVHSGKINTRVLGTSFNIKAYTDDPRITVTVTAGKVAVGKVITGKVATGKVATGKVTAGKVTAGKVAVENIILEKDQQLVYANGTFTRQQHTTNETAWKNDNIIFLSTPVPEAVHTLERRFNVKISVNEKLYKCLFFGDFNQEPLESILKMLAASVNGKLVKENNGYHIEGDGCY
jgi:transmembrane sensor